MQITQKMVSNDMSYQNETRFDDVHLLEKVKYAVLLSPYKSETDILNAFIQVRSHASEQDQKKFSLIIENNNVTDNLAFSLHVGTEKIGELIAKKGTNNIDISYLKVIDFALKKGVPIDLDKIARGDLPKNLVSYVEENHVSDFSVLEDIIAQSTNDFICALVSDPDVAEKINIYRYGMAIVPIEHKNEFEQAFGLVGANQGIKTLSSSYGYASGSNQRQHMLNRLTELGIFQFTENCTIDTCNANLNIHWSNDSDYFKNQDKIQNETLQLNKGKTHTTKSNEGVTQAWRLFLYENKKSVNIVEKLAEKSEKKGLDRTIEEFLYKNLNSGIKISDGLTDAMKILIKKNEEKFSLEKQKEFLLSLPGDTYTQIETALQRAFFRQTSKLGLDFFCQQKIPVFFKWESFKNYQDDDIKHSINNIDGKLNGAIQNGLKSFAVKESDVMSKHWQDKTHWEREEAAKIERNTKKIKENEINMARQDEIIAQLENKIEQLNKEITPFLKKTKELEDEIRNEAIKEKPLRAKIAEVIDEAIEKEKAMRDNILEIAGIDKEELNTHKTTHSVDINALTRKYGHLGKINEVIEACKSYNAIIKLKNEILQQGLRRKSSDDEISFEKIITKKQEAIETFFLQMKQRNMPIPSEEQELRVLLEKQNALGKERDSLQTDQNYIALQEERRKQRLELTKYKGEKANLEKHNVSLYEENTKTLRQPKPITASEQRYAIAKSHDNILKLYGDTSVRLEIMN